VRSRRESLDYLRDILERRASVLDVLLAQELNQVLKKLGLGGLRSG